jgi:eukaryotic-like serine/threonine-protein kinase
MRSSQAPAPALVGMVVGGRYRVIQLLGSGGTGQVYLAELCDSTRSGKPPVPRRRFALKMLRDEHCDEPELVARFDREAMAAARIRHPNVLAVESAPTRWEGDGERCRFFVMELLVGLDLADTLSFTGSLGQARSVRVAEGAALGLGAAHEAGVVHRDVKPENLFLVHAPDGREQVKVLDFGFSHLPGDPEETRGHVVGTPEYMAPEQARGAAADPRADVYSLGVVLYEMLAGHAPFTGSYARVAKRHARERPPPIHSALVSAPLDAVVRRALEKDPEARFPSMAAFRAALRASLPGAG